MGVHELDIIPISTDKSLTAPPVPYSHVLPQHEFGCMVVASPGKGKTNWILNLITRQYKGYFHKIIVCSPTVRSDPKWFAAKQVKHVLVENKKLKNIMFNMHSGEVSVAAPPIPSKTYRVVSDAADDNEYGSKTTASDKKDIFTGELTDDDFYENMNSILPVMTEQKRIIEDVLAPVYGPKGKFYADRILLVLDDQAGLFKASATNNPIVNFVFKHRHYYTSFIIATQAYRAIPRPIRLACSCCVMFKITNETELEALREEWPGDMTKDEWYRVYEYCTSEDFSFMYINVKFPSFQQVFKNFRTRIRLE